MKDLERFKDTIRKDVLEMLLHRGYGHLGGSLSLVETMAVLYGKYINKEDESRDQVVLSKGHCGPVWYAALAESGFFPKEELFTLNEGGSRMPSHPVRTLTPGVDMTTGSLGQGTSAAAGLALAHKMKQDGRSIFVIVGDGELNEGQCWEAFQFMTARNLNNCIVLIDENKKQLDGYTKDVMNPFDLAKKMEAFGFHTQEVNGQDLNEIDTAIQRAKAQTEMANCIVLHTTKGAGVPYFEELMDNHSVQFSKEENRKAAEQAIKELEEKLHV